MKTKLILNLIVSLFLIVSVSAFSSNYFGTGFNGLCYQETTNKSTSSDGNCGLDYTGNYSNVQYTNINPYPAIDGNWNTGISIFVGGYANFGMMYKKPLFSNYGSMLQVKGTVTISTVNITIPLDCWNAYPDRVYFDYFYLYPQSQSYFYCRNLTGSNDMGYPLGIGLIYEEAMYWNITNSTSENLTFIGNEQNHFIPRYLQVPQNTLLTNTYMNLTGLNNSIKINSNDYSLSTIGTGSGGCSTPNLVIYNTSAGNYTLSVLLNATGVTNPINISIQKCDISESTCINSGVKFRVLNNTSLVFNITNLLTDSSYPKFTLFPECNNQLSNSLGTNTIYINSVNINSYPNDVELVIGNNYYKQIEPNTFNYSYKTENLANAINSYLLSCSYLNGVCNVPFKFFSQSAGIINYQNLNFDNNNFSINQLTYNNNTFETSRENFILNITYDYLSYPVSTATFYYNGTGYLASGVNGYYNVSSDIPLVNSDNTIKNFFWSIGLTNSSGTFYFNTSVFNQTVNRINLSNCGGDTNILALNFTSYDATTFTKLTNWNFKATLSYYLGSGIFYRNVTFNNPSITEKTICIRNNTNYKVSGDVQYSALNYDTSDYNLNSITINNITSNVSLYLLNVSSTTTFILNVISQAQLPLKDYYIYIYRYDPSLLNPVLVGIAKTDSNGQSIGYFETYTVDYKFVITDTLGNNVFTSEKRKIIPESTPYTITFIVGTPIPSPFSYYQNVSGFSYNPVLTYNTVSGITSVGYSDSNPNFQIAILKIGYLNNSYNNDSLVCNISSTNPSGYLQCTLNASLSGFYYAEFNVIRDGTVQFIDRIVFNVKSIPEGIKMLSLLGAFFIMLIFGTVFFYNAIAGIISIDIGFLVCELLGLTNIGWLGITSIIGISVLIIIVLGRD